MGSAGEQKISGALHDAVPVFWSGGVESSFRVLDLIIRHRYPVQPVYFVHINEGRRNHSPELAAMDRIRSGVEATFPDRAALLRPTIVISRDELDPGETIVHQAGLLGDLLAPDSQYVWLAAATDKLGFGSIEVGIKKNVRGLLSTHPCVLKNLIPYTWPVGAQSYALKDWIPETAVEEGMQLVQKFAYPLIHTSIAEISQIAKDHGFADLMKQTWTCHRPLGNQQCGYCYVCSSAIQDGKGMYFPRAARIRNKLSIVPRNVMRLARAPLSKVKRFLLRKIKQLHHW